MPVGVNKGVSVAGGVLSDRCRKNPLIRPITDVYRVNVEDSRSGWKRSDDVLAELGRRKVQKRAVLHSAR